MVVLGTLFSGAGAGHGQLIGIGLVAQITFCRYLERGHCQETTKYHVTISWVTALSNWCQARITNRDLHALCFVPSLSLTKRPVSTNRLYTLHRFRSIISQNTKKVRDGNGGPWPGYYIGGAAHSSCTIQ